MDRRSESVGKLPNTLVQLMKQQIETSRSRIDSPVRPREGVGSSIILDENLIKDDILPNSLTTSLVRIRGSSLSKLPNSLVDLRLKPKKSAFNQEGTENENFTLKDIEKNLPFTGRKLDESRLID